MTRLQSSPPRGLMLIQTLVVAVIGAVVLGSLVSWSYVLIRAARSAQHRALAVSIAEAGIDYYRWHLAHAPTDYQDGTGTAGPYVHDFEDKNGTVIGQFTLEITPPPVGSTLVTVRSTGTILAAPSVREIVEVALAKPSIAKFAVVSNDVMRFGEGTEVFGPIHSNGGIRFDGLAHNLISSADDQYKDPDHSGNDEWAVHTHLFPTDLPPPAPLAPRTDVFEAGRQISVPAIDFAGFTSNLAQIKADAQASGRYFAASGALGYRILLKTDDTFDLYRVNTLEPVPNGCTNAQGQQGWGTWSIRSTAGAQTLLGTHAFPDNGLIFVEDDVWVEGQINTARITIAAARFPDNPSQRRNIIVNNDLLYTNYDGQDVIALMAQGNFNVGMFSQDDLRIDAAIIAQNGRVGRHYYRPPTWMQDRCAPYHQRDVLTLYGMVGTYERYGFAYTDGTGYTVRNIVYDANLLYSPPPSFPLTSDQYEIIYWKRKKN